MVERDNMSTRTVAHARRTDPVTSHQAAESVKGLRASQEAVLHLFSIMQEGMTDEEVAGWYPRYTGDVPFPAQSPSGLRTRRKELVDAGYLQDSGERRRMTTGRMAIVWQLADRTAGTQTIAASAAPSRDADAVAGADLHPEPDDVPAVIPGQTDIFEMLEGADGR